MPTDSPDFLDAAKGIFAPKTAPASEVDVSDLSTSDLVDYGSDQAKAELKKRTQELADQFKDQLATILKYGSTGATVGSFFAPPIGTAIGGGVGLAVGAILAFWSDIRGWFGGDTGLSADVRESVYAPVRAITSAHLSTDPKSWPETAARAQAYASFLDDFINKYADAMDRGDIEDWHDWIRHLHNVEARMYERIQTHQDARAVQQSDAISRWAAMIQAAPPSILDVTGQERAQRAANARLALRAAHSTLAHLAVGDPAARQLVAQLHNAAHVDISADRATRILRIAAAIPAPAWRFI